MIRNKVPLSGCDWSTVGQEKTANNHNKERHHMNPSYKAITLINGPTLRFMSWTCEIGDLEQVVGEEENDNPEIARQVKLVNEQLEEEAIEKEQKERDKRKGI